MADNFDGGRNAVLSAQSGTSACGKRRRGKSGGARVIYYFHDERHPLFLLNIYVKNRQSNMSAAERKEVRRLLPLLISTYSKGKKR